MANYEPIIQSEAARFNIDPNLIRAVIQTESSGNANARSGKGAVGLGQLMPETAKALGVTDPKDPAQNIRGIAALLDQNLTRYGNVQDALRAYHGGTDQKNWGELTQAYPQKVMSNMAAPQAPKTLPGIPTSQQQGQQNDEDIFAAFSGQKSPQQTQQGSSDDQIFSAFTQQKTAPAEQVKVPVSAPAGQPSEDFLGKLQSIGAGAGNAFGQGMLGLQSLAGRGIKALGDAVGPAPTLSGLVTGQQPQGALAQAGQWLINDAAQGRAKLEAENAPYMQANPLSNIGGQVVGTLAPGAAVAKGLGAGANLAARTVGAGKMAAPLVQAISTGGANAGKLGGLAGLATRAAGGAVTGAGLGAVYNPENIGTSAAIGGAVPVIGAGLGKAGSMISSALGGDVSGNVGALAQLAKKYGIDIRPDQIINSKPVQAISAALDYLPFSGKGAATTAQQQQFKTAISNTIGENTPNLIEALSSAKTRLGGEFDKALKGTTVHADNTLVSDLSSMLGNARNEMTDQQFGVINRQVDNLLSKVQPGDTIASDAAYNIKKSLDRMAKSNDSTLAYYARDMRDSLMGALSRSMPDAGAAFAKTRQQWANMMELQKLVPAGAEGDISVARLANARGIKTPELSDLRDIAAQFLKPKIADSGTAQRAAAMGAVPSFVANPVLTTGTLAAGRAANTVLGSPALGSAIANRAVNRALQSTPSLNAPGLQRAGLLGLLQPGALASLSELGRQPVPVSR